jgi:hypothetical protein
MTCWHTAETPQNIRPSKPLQEQYDDLRKKIHEIEILIENETDKSN